MSTDDTRPDLPAVLSAVAIRSYMRATGWTEGTQGSHGSVFTKAGFKLSVPHEDDDPDATRMALYRLAVAEKRAVGETEAAVWSYRDARGSEAVPGVPASGDSGRDLPSAPERAQPRAATVTDQDVTVALLADVQFHKAARSLVWTSPSSEAVRAMLEAAAPRLVAAERDRAEAAEARLAEVRETIAAFFTYHGNSAAFALRSARDLAEGVRQVLDRAPLEAPEAAAEATP